MATLARVLWLRDLVLIVIGTVIGSGIFLVPGGVLRDSGGHLGLALAVWLIAGVLSLLGALTYGELGAMDPEAGGIYVYVRGAFGPLPAFLYGWTLFFVISGPRDVIAIRQARNCRPCGVRRMAGLREPSPTRHWCVAARWLAWAGDSRHRHW